MRQGEKKLQNNRKRRITVALLSFSILVVGVAIAIMVVDRANIIGEEREKLATTFAKNYSIEPRICAKSASGTEKCSNEYEGLMIDDAIAAAKLDGFEYEIVNKDVKRRNIESSDRVSVGFHVVYEVVVKATFTMSDDLERLYIVDGRRIKDEE